MSVVVIGATTEKAMDEDDILPEGTETKHIEDSLHAVSNPVRTGGIDSQYFVHLMDRLCLDW